VPRDFFTNEENNIMSGGYIRNIFVRTEN